MFIWFGKKAFMRGPVWFLFLIGSIALLIGGILLLSTGSEPKNLSAFIIFSIFAFLYIIAYFALPKRMKPQVKTPQPTVNAALEIPAKLIIIRDSSAIGALVPTVISLNGVQVASLQNGSSVQILITMSHNVLLTNSVGSKNVRYEFDVQNGAVGEIHVKGGVFQIKTAIWKNPTYKEG